MHAPQFTTIMQRVAQRPPATYLVRLLQQTIACSENCHRSRAPPRGRPRQTPGRSGGSIPAGTFRANKVVAPVPASCQPTPRPASPAAGPPGPSYAFVAGSDPVAAMDTSLPAPAGPAAGPVCAAAATPSCTPTATPSVSPASSPAGPPAPTNPQ
ncbi:TPA: hypothetical protein ACH3X1_006879 [Trebouxia sp. C0004]